MFHSLDEMETTRCCIIYQMKYLCFTCMFVFVFKCLSEDSSCLLVCYEKHFNQNYGVVGLMH